MAPVSSVRRQQDVNRHGGRRNGLNQSVESGQPVTSCPTGTSNANGIAVNFLEEDS